MDNPDEFGYFISTMLEKNPTWLGVALESITRGMQAAIYNAEKRAGDKDNAMLAALTLASKHRLGPELLTTLRDRVAKSIDPAHACGIEQEYLKK